MLFMGIDIGTQGARCVISDECGRIAAAHSVPFAGLNIAKHAGWAEQSPDAWAAAARDAICACTRDIKNPDEIISISVDGTSGTIVPLDKEFRPLMNGIMYNDPRAAEEAKLIHQRMGAVEDKLGYKFGGSFSLPRILWLYKHMPGLCEKTRVFAHQADYIAGLLCGEFSTSDYSNALKTGYDLVDGRWFPEYEAALGLELEKLPDIVRPGGAIAHVTRGAAQALRLSEKTIVTGGSTDGYASALAAGATEEGRWASILGTTFALKGVTRDLVRDPSGACYSHLLPDGSWLLGGASNLGGRVLNGAREGRSFDEMNAQSEDKIPTGARCYPLPGRGERFPFVKSDCEAFYAGDITNGRLYPAIMEGIGFAERMIYERMERMGCAVGAEIRAAGGACKSDLWLKIRASILNRRLVVPEVVDAAMGSALLAASAHFGSLREAANHMIRCRKTVEPDAELTARYDEIYRRFEQDMIAFYGAEAVQ